MKHNSTITDANTCRGRKKERKNSLEEKRGYPVLHLVIPALGQDPTEREGRDLPAAAPPFPLVIPCLPKPSKKRPRATSLGKDEKAHEKQVGCWRADISIQGMTSPQVVTHRRTLARQQVAKGEVVFMGNMDGGGVENIYKLNSACLFPLSH